MISPSLILMYMSVKIPNKTIPLVSILNLLLTESYIKLFKSVTDLKDIFSEFVLSFRQRKSSHHKQHNFTKEKTY